MPRSRSSADLLIEDHKIRKFVTDKYKLRRHPEDRDRADPRRSEGHPARGPAGRDHRPQGPAGRAAAGRAARAWSAGGSTSRSRKSPGPRLQAQLVAEDIAEQLAKRASFRRTMKRAIEQTMEAGAKGIKIQLAGRLGGSEMARREKADRRLDPALHAAGEDRLRLCRSQDRPGPHRRPGVDQPRHVRGRDRWR